MVAAGGLLLTLRVSLHDQLNGNLVLGWVLTLAGLLVVLSGLAARRPSAAAGRVLGPVVLALGIAGVAVAAEAAITTLHGNEAALACRDDVATASAAGGRLVRQGANPYTAYDAVVEEARCGADPGTVTRRGRFAGRDSVPSAAEIHAAALAARSDPSAPEFERRLDYPAGTVLAGMAGMRLLVVLVVVALGVGVAAATLRAPRRLRAVVLPAMLAQVAAYTLIGDGHADGIAAGLAVAAWTMPEAAAGGLLLGLACSVKQTAWFLVPALWATAWSRGGATAALRSVLATAASFAVVNVGFVVADPGAWLRGVLAPLTDSLFPLGAGLVGLVTSGRVGVGWLWAFDVAMAAVVVLSVVAALRWDRRAPGVAAVIATMALWVGPRSLLEYMAAAGMLAVAVAATRPRAEAGVAISPPRPA